MLAWLSQRTYDPELMAWTGPERRAGEMLPLRRAVRRNPLSTAIAPKQERAWYDSHRASLVPEPDVETVFEDIKKGTTPARARDRGLSVRHLAPFLNASIWSALDDSDNVSC